MCGIRSKVSEQMSYKQLAILFPKLAHIPPELDKIPTYYQDLWGITVNANNHFGLLFATHFFSKSNLKHASSY